jgi:hypothetical protein
MHYCLKYNSLQIRQSSVQPDVESKILRSSSR